MNRAGINQSQLAEMVGVKQPSIGRLLTGETKTTRAIDTIARVLDTTSAYLKGQDDSVGGHLPHPVDGDDDRLALRPGEQRLPFRHGASHQTPAMAAADLGLVPVREVDLALGFGAAYLDQDIGSAVRYFPREWLDLYTRAPADKLIITRGSGDSMVPTLFDQDLILIDTSDRMPRLTDQVWAVSYCGLGSVKRLRPTKDGGWLLMSDNPTISAITAYDDEMHVLGRVCGYFRKV
jgi:phage repressor protein C with HTH and peptisase S24 domain